jgi:hypothetical protein
VVRESRVALDERPRSGGAYEANGDNPIGLFEAGGLRLDLDRLLGDVGPMAIGGDDGLPSSSDGEMG